METIEKLRFARHHDTLHTWESPADEVYWCSMHADLCATPGRACFKSELVEDILRYQQALAFRVRAEQARGTHRLPHVVLMSETDAFNLGGDLELFCRLIRAHDRNALLNYARRCVRAAHAFHMGLGIGAHSIALVQGDALGGGFEAALACHTIVAERGVGMGMPEVLFDLFPGMGAYSFLCKRIAPASAEKMMLDGKIYRSEALFEMGLVDVLVERGQGIEAVEEICRRNLRIASARSAIHQVRAIAQPVLIEELLTITELWVDTAMRLSEKSLRMMERLVRAQYRRHGHLAAAQA